MDITQKDRDSLRNNQQSRVQSAFTVGNLIEHQVQDPARYKALSRREQGLGPDSKPTIPHIRYESKYYPGSNEQSELVEDLSIKNDLQPMPAISGNDERNLPIDPGDARSNLWLHMDRVEFDKLEWMTHKAEKIYKERLLSTTQFNSDGLVISKKDVKRMLDDISYKTDDNTSDQQLHDIGGLVKLLDSQFQPQITYALNVVSKIANRTTTGYYDGIFDDNLMAILLKECLLRVRYHMDSKNETICQGALRCLKALICNTQIDELFLDRLHPILSEQIHEPLWLNDEAAGMEFDIDMEDSRCVELDAILTLIIRTDLLSRLEYLMKVKNGKFAANYIDLILDILIRLARHSRGIAEIIGSSDIPRMLVDRFLQPDIMRADKFTQFISIRVMKLLRIVAQASREIAETNGEALKYLVPKSVIPILEIYYNIELDIVRTANDDMLFKVVIETLRTMKVLAQMKDMATSIYQIVVATQENLLRSIRFVSTQLEPLKIIESRISLDWQYAAHVIDLIGYLLQYEAFQFTKSALQSTWSNMATTMVLKWVADLIRDNYIPHLDVSITISCALQHFPKSLMDSSQKSSALTVLCKSEYMNENVSLKFFKHLVGEAQYKTQLINILERDGRLRDATMLLSYGCLDYNSSPTHVSKLNPILENDSPFILLDMYVKILYDNRCTLKELVGSYINDLNTIRYLRCATRYFKYENSYEVLAQGSVWVQQEVQIMMPLILLQLSYHAQEEGILAKPGYDLSKEAKSSSVVCNTKESLSNMIISAISIIGLAESCQNVLISLREKLLEDVLLNDELHKRLAIATYKIPPPTNHSELVYNRRKNLDSIGQKDVFILEGEEGLLLKPIYTCMDNPDRFWILEPLIDYYNCRRNENISVKDQNFFSSTIKDHLGYAVSYKDSDFVASLLRFHASILYTCKAYAQIILGPNLEEFFCVIGSIFLDDSLFLDSKVGEALRLNLEFMAAECIDGQKLFSDASRKLETLKIPLNDFFNKLVDQYDSCSYGDPVFTNFVLMFITSSCDKAFKKKLFSEKVETCVGQMKIPLEDVWILPRLLVEQPEEDKEVRQLIKLAGQHIVPKTFMDYYRRKQLANA